MYENEAKAAYAAKQYAACAGGLSQQIKPTTMSDRVEEFARRLNDANQQIADILSRIYGPEPAGPESATTQSQCLTSNLESVEVQIGRLFNLVKRLHNVA
jgi:hypothetical protein